MTRLAWSPAVLCLLVAAAHDPDRYVIDASASRFTATIGTSGLLSAFGHDHVISFREFTGDARLSEDDAERGSLRMTIQAASLVETGKGFSDDDRKTIERDAREQALEVSKHPEIVFKSTGLSSRQTGSGEYRFDIRGDLTLHGVTRSLTVPARVTLQGDTLTARGEFTVLHRDYKIRRLSAAAGTVKASDEIRMSFEIVARKP
jgi:polyisoprenoid-binding protein YceI